MTINDVKMVMETLHDVVNLVDNKCLRGAVTARYCMDVDDPNRGKVSSGCAIFPFNAISGEGKYIYLATRQDLADIIEKIDHIRTIEIVKNQKIVIKTSFGIFGVNDAKVVLEVFPVEYKVMFTAPQLSWYCRLGELQFELYSLRNFVVDCLNSFDDVEKKLVREFPKPIFL
jgi:hypothetical protein